MHYLKPCVGLKIIFETLGTSATFIHTRNQGCLASFNSLHQCRCKYVYFDEVCSIKDYAPVVSIVKKEHNSHNIA